MKILKLIENLNITFYYVAVATWFVWIHPGPWAAAALLIWAGVYALETLKGDSEVNKKINGIAGELNALKFRYAELKTDTPHRTELERINTAIEGINGDLADVIKSHADIAKMAEDTKKLLSQSNLASTFAPKKRQM